MSVRSFFQPLYRAELMRQIDRCAIDTHGIPSLDLMENAGTRSAEIVLDLRTELKVDGTVLVLCGPGNNGGDGLVVARCLAARGVKVNAFVIAQESALTPDARANLDRARKAKVSVTLTPPVQIPPDTGLVVDALLGTGARGALRSPFDEWSAACRQAGVPVVAIDAPSGVDLDTGAVEGEAFSAVATVALGELKPGFFLFPGRSHAGRVVQADIGLPAQARAAVHTDLYLITAAGVRDILPERPRDGHKGTFGRVAVLAGSTGMSGAAILASVASLRAGCGLVSLGVPQSLNDVCEVKATEVITRPFPEVKGKGTFSKRSSGEIVPWLEPAQSLVMGCGMGRHHETQELLGLLVERQTAPLVLDADGLFPFGKDPDRLVRHRAPLVITPHPGELANLLSVSPDEVQADRIAMARRAARHFDCVCVLKGATTVVASVTGQAYLNPTGNSGMGTAGSGDVLAGIIGSLVAQGMSMLGAATAGVYLHGLAGDLAAQIVGERGLIASDLIDSLPDALLSVESGEWAGYY